MKLLTLLFALFCSVAASAQDTWTVWTGTKVLHRFNEENPEKNRLKLSPARLKQGYIRVNYQPQEKPADWIRTLAVFDSTGDELFQKKGNELRLTAAQLKKWKAKKNIQVYTWALPSDPKMAAAVRVRRIHLVAIGLE